jgi:hypothetical protein
MKFFKYLILISLLNAHLYGEKDRIDRSNSTCFKHAIQLQLANALGFPVENTNFWVTLDVIKQGPLVTIQLPLINFQTGPEGTIPPGIAPLVPGGYIITSAGFLPEELRPLTVVPVSTIGASNNGMSPVFSFTQSPESLPVPPAGYIVQITQAGELQIQGAGAFGNIIAPGPQILLPCTISYVAKTAHRLCKNKTLSTGATDTTQWTGGAYKAAGTGIRDTHIIDAYNGVVAFAWADNSMFVDKANNTSNVMVALGRIKNGKLKVGKPLQLTDSPVGSYIFSTAVAINRANPDIITVSWGVSNLPTIPYRAVSFDGGKTWPINGPTNIQPTGKGGAGDNRGIACDIFGNVWYSTTNAFDTPGKQINQPTFWVSGDGGATFAVAYTAPIPAPIPADSYDFPQFCFGGDPKAGTYGLYFVVDQVGAIDGVQALGFIPIFGSVAGSGLNNVGAGTIVSLNNPNSNSTAFIAASQDSRVWLFGIPNVYANSAAGGTYAAFTSIVPHGINFQPAGALGEHIAGPWDVAMNNNAGLEYSGYFEASGQISQPFFGYFDSPVIYDDHRQALYVLYCGRSPYFSQDMNIYFLISVENGITWSEPVIVNDVSFANRGFPSMALDPRTHDLVFGFYDGRNDDTYKSVEYMAAIIPAKKLDELVATLK